MARPCYSFHQCVHPSQCPDLILQPHFGEYFVMVLAGQ